MTQPKLVWSERHCEGYWVADLLPGYVLCVQPIIDPDCPATQPSVGILNITDDCDCYFVCVCERRRSYDEEWVKSEPRTQPDHVDAMCRAEEMAREWLREIGAAL